MSFTNSQPVDPLLRFPDVFGDRRRGIPGLIPMSKSKAYDMIKKGLLPQPVHIGRNSFFRLSTIQQVIDKAAA
jgi:predicted DNA-binding transcriptional regulator AlpA